MVVIVARERAVSDVRGSLGVIHLVRTHKFLDFEPTHKHCAHKL